MAACEEEKMTGADGEAVTSRQRFREATTSLRFRQAKMATFSLNCATAAGADGTSQVFEVVQPEVDVAIRATQGDISHRCAATLLLYSASLRREQSTSFRNNWPPHS
ncbi:hypothetical protein HPB52_015297 [Rhipicephalus sanguineus]|uniref:Uncharacterized protein n=1 Tax=Rhipicephalus sanguineus TaxID=34632 RepID=A0A9D4PWI2_RHISA|nr:hypothetical protein HPB52_015297 [Rhipicephalus sanguineus]